MFLILCCKKMVLGKIKGNKNNTEIFLELFIIYKEYFSMSNLISLFYKQCNYFELYFYFY